MIKTPGIAFFVATCTVAAVFAQQSPPGPPPQDASFFQAQAMRALSEKADLLLEQKRTDLAIQELRRVYAFEVAKTHPIFEMKVRLVGRLAGLYAATGQKAEALETVKGMLADLPPGTPAEAAAWLDAGTVFRGIGMPDEALKAFDRAIELSTKLAQGGGRPPRRDGAPERRPREGPGGDGAAQPQPRP